MIIDPYKNRNPEQRIIKDADQTEVNAMLRGSVLFDAGLYDDRVSGAMDDFDPEDRTVTQRWHQEDLKYETASGEIYEEIERRYKLLGESYPFEINGSQLIYRSSQTNYYEFCLAISTSPTITAGDYVNLPRVFERTCTLLAELYLGNDSDSVHVGSPRDEEIGTTFFKAMQKVNELTGEWVWNAIEDFGKQPQTTGDEGLDFIVWKNTPDGRKGKVFIIGQCACGDDWTTKFNDLTIDKISKWFHPLSYVKHPIRAFATPYHLSNMNLVNAQNDAGLVFDRARLTKLAEQFSQNIELQGWRPKIDELIKLVMPTMQLQL
ncbi:hypothetical protein [Parafilimonas sp.]|uniref:hypothetical protein n=1 Tax=Parafilimonas sp. TaxID=1969739 RepID=UPI0039E6DFA1